MRVPPPTPLPAAAPSPVTPPPSSSPPGACCFLFKARNCAALGEPGALIYIFLCPALTPSSNLALSTADPERECQPQNTHAKSLPGAHPARGLGAHSALSPSLLSPSLSPFQSSHLSLRPSLLSLSRFLFSSSFLLLYSPPCRWLTRSPGPLSSFAPAVCPRLNRSPCRLSAFSLAALKRGGSSPSGGTPWPPRSLGVC